MENIVNDLAELEDLATVIAGSMAVATQVVGCSFDDSAAVGRLRDEVHLIIGHERRFKQLMTDLLSRFILEWNDIIQNDMRIGQIKKYLSVCCHFRKKVNEFDECITGCGNDMDYLVGDNWFARRYYVMMDDWRNSASTMIEYAEKDFMVEPHLADPFDVAVRRLRRFFKGVSADSLREFVMNGVSLKDKPKWLSDKRQAVIMGTMLGISCRDMNNSFLFTGKDGQPMRLNYTSNQPHLDISSYEIYPVIKALKEAVVKIKKQQKDSNEAVA